jgi:hypothetical protein
MADLIPGSTTLQLNEDTELMINTDTDGGRIALRVYESGEWVTVETSPLSAMALTSASNYLRSAARQLTGSEASDG